MKDLIQSVIPNYSEPHRHYHNLEHIARLLTFHERYKEQSGINWTQRKEKALYLAILFHDVIYDIKQTDKSNESKSAIFFFERYHKMGISKGTANQVATMIMATEFHFRPNMDFNFEYSTLTQYFMDLDLLGIATTNLDQLFEDNHNIDDEFITEFPRAEVYKKRLAFITDVMKPNFKFRVLNDRLLLEQAKANIDILIDHYSMVKGFTL